MTEAITLKLILGDKTGKLIPSGVTETLRCEIVDELCLFRFNDSRTTRKFVMLDNEISSQKGELKRSIFNVRLSKGMTSYPGKKKEEIKELLMVTFKQWGAKE